MFLNRPSLFAIFLALASLVHGLAKLEPADGKLIFGPWWDSSSGPVSGGETPKDFNQKMGFNSGVFQIYQYLPPKPPTNGKPDYDAVNHNPDGTINMNVFNDGTNAAIFLTVYPQNLTGIAASDITNLGNQCQTIIKTTGRNVFIRFGPEMNGDWMPYSGNAPAFISLWRQIYTTITTIAPTVAFVWSPSSNTPSNQYPYNAYWPGPEYVDWVGLSIYWRGYNDNYPISYLTNTLCPSDFTAQLLDSTAPLERTMQGGPTSFYQEYAVGFDKPVAISEGGGAFTTAYTEVGSGFVTQVDAGPGRTATIMSFWNSNIFNAGFMAKYPRLKLAIAFEIWKDEAEGGQYMAQRDCRVSGDPDTIAAFQSNMQVLDKAGVMVWAKEISTTTSVNSSTITTTSIGSGVGGGAVATGTNVTGVAVVTNAPVKTTQGNAQHTSNFRLMCKLGEGTFSEVLKVKHKRTGQIYAMKRFRKHFNTFEEIEGLREIQALKRLNPHPHIVDLHDVVFEPRNGVLSLNFELMDCNLYELISRKNLFMTESKAKMYMHQICKGLEYIHGKGIFHRDIKPENILVKDFNIKIADFGSCRGIHSKQPYTEYIATRWYRPPECLLCDGIYTYKMDIWSAGCVLYEVISKQPLFPGSNELDQIHRIHNIMGTPSPKLLKQMLG
ncbi:hypothetical protein HDU98_009169 [Podochytrium sp. JEL0797]|nr:hypothetical protein HDU98_009169 [Podochytrium sp. JEL0797]